MHFRVVVAHRGRHHHRIGRRGVLRVVADRDADALRRQAARRRAFAEIGAADLVALVGQHLGDARHAGAADADEVDALDLVLHGLPFLRASSAQACATTAVASGRARRAPSRPSAPAAGATGS
jgi:hypothetical protein